ncbi:MAG: restriction endonuclease subunit M [Halomonas sp.]|nr:restriction endonuclease subunit M [Halomonas sp.]|tara:strand:+ start:11446 stop:12192 length:747 start_codon:yes stop_codon:yes gene_type:complete
MNTNYERTEFAKLIQSIAYDRQTWEVWSDFIEMSAISLSNAVDLHEATWQERENKYLQIARKYKPEQLQKFAKALAMLVDEMHEPRDFLGQTFMALELGNKWKGQFFTPDALCNVMAAVTLGDTVHKHIDEYGYFTVNEPACGGGATIIGIVNALKAMKINYQQHMHVTAVDLDIRSVHMCYVQLSLLHVPAVIVHGNTLTLEEYSHWHTPAHIMHGWNRKLKQKNKPKPVRTEPLRVLTKDDQISMF